MIRSSSGVSLLIDSGATRHLLPFDWLSKESQSLIEPSSVRLRAANGGSVEVAGFLRVRLLVSVWIDGHWSKVPVSVGFQVCHGLNRGILSAGLMRATLDMRRQSWLGFQVGDSTAWAQLRMEGTLPVLCVEFCGAERSFVSQHGAARVLVADEDELRSKRVSGRKIHDPSESEIRGHQVLHMPYASWCTACVAGRSVAD